MVVPDAIAARQRGPGRRCRCSGRSPANRRGSRSSRSSTRRLPSRGESNEPRCVGERRQLRVLRLAVDRHRDVFAVHVNDDEPQGEVGGERLALPRPRPSARGNRAAGGRRHGDLSGGRHRPSCRTRPWRSARGSSQVLDHRSLRPDRAGTAGIPVARVDAAAVDRLDDRPRGCRRRCRRAPAPPSTSPPSRRRRTRRRRAGRSRTGGRTMLAVSNDRRAGAGRWPGRSSNQAVSYTSSSHASSGGPMEQDDVAAVLAPEERPQRRRT